MMYRAGTKNLPCYFHDMSCVYPCFMIYLYMGARILIYVYFS